MKITLDIKNLDNIHNPDQHIERFEEIFTALISSGGLTGVTGGKTILHFDAKANFMGVQLDYWPYRKRSSP